MCQRQAWYDAGVENKKLIGNAIAEFAPIVTFVVASELVGFMEAIVWLIGVALLSLLLEWRLARRIPKFGILASTTILFFGLLSIVTQNEFFIIVKDTLYALSFGIILFIGHLSNRTFLKFLFGDFFAMNERGWQTLTIRWTFFFLLLAIGNEIARFLLTPQLWVYYKFLTLVVTWLFGFYQFTLARKERLPEANAWGLRIHP